jgi:hypothetical protein
MHPPTEGVVEVEVGAAEAAEAVVAATLPAAR